MVARRGRSSKSVLSRQHIAGRRKALAEQKLRAPTTGQKALAGLALGAVAALTFLSIVSFDARDRVGPGFRNAVGPVGHAIAELFRGLIGLGAFLVPAVAAYAGLTLFVGPKGTRRWSQVISMVLLAVAAMVSLELAFGRSPGWSHPPGGSLGAELTIVLEGLFSFAGTVVLVGALCIAALIIGTQITFFKLCALAYGTVVALVASGRELAGRVWEAQREAMAKRREARQREREEEAEFLAQLEADEAELEEAERRLAEKEAAEARQRELEEAKRARSAQKQPPAPTKLERRPNLITAPPPPEQATREPNPSLDARPEEAPAAAAAAASAVAPPSPKAESVPEPVPLPAPERGPSAARSPPSGTGRTPVIVEPKAPPKPTKKKDPEQFEFIGDRKFFAVPPIDVLECDKKERTAIDKEGFFSTAERLRTKLADFGIVGEVVEIRPGPVVTMYEFLPGPGIKISKIASLADDLAMAMEAMRVRIVAPIPGKGVVGIEVPNKDRETVYLKEIAEQDAFQKSTSRLTMCLGKDIEGMPYVLDLAKAPHLLMAGTTGSGKSVAVNSMIMSLLLKSTPEEVRFIMVDPKMLELSVYEGIPHLLLPVVTDPKKAALALRWAVEEMERRYQLLSEVGVRNIAGYNKLVESQAIPAEEPPKTAKPKKRMLIVDVGDEAPTAPSTGAEDAQGSGGLLGVPAPQAEREEPRALLSGPELEAKSAEVETEIRVDDKALELSSAEAEVAAQSPVEPGAEEEAKPRKKLPYIVVIIDELADLMMVASREVETYIARLAQMARAAGIHLMVATQRPSTDVVTGVIKANFPTRVSFMLRSKPDSMTILGTVGAEALLGMGDMLIMPPTSAHLQRVHGAFVSEPEIKRAVDHLKAQGKPVYDESILKARDEDADGAPEEDELSDELWDQAVAVVSEMRAVSISMLQRKMRIGYNRAARMIERMEREGIVGPADGAKPREVLLRAQADLPSAGAM